MFDNGGPHDIKTFHLREILAISGHACGNCSATRTHGHCANGSTMAGGPEAAMD